MTMSNTVGCPFPSLVFIIPACMTSMAKWLAKEVFERGYSMEKGINTRLMVSQFMVIGPTVASQDQSKCMTQMATFIFKALWSRNWKVGLEQFISSMKIPCVKKRSLMTRLRDLSSCIRMSRVVNLGRPSQVPTKMIFFTVLWLYSMSQDQKLRRRLGKMAIWLRTE